MEVPNDMAGLDYESVAEQVIKILKKCVNLSEEQLDPAHWQEPLTGFFYGLSMTDMVYFFLEIESEFGIRIQPDALGNYGFSSIAKICKIIQGQP